MSQIQPASGRLLQSLQSRISPSTQTLFAGTPLAPAQPGGVTVADTVPPAQTVVTPQVPDDDFEPSTPAILNDDLGTPSPVVADDPADLNESEKLDIFDEVLKEVESNPEPPQLTDLQVADQVQPDLAPSPQQTIVSALDPDAVYQPSEDSGIFAQAIPAAVDQAQHELDQQAQQQIPQAGGRQKEHLEGSSNVAAPELPADIYYVEEEKNPEIPPEVESYIQHVEDAAKIEPQKIVVAQEAIPDLSGAPTPPRIVKVLPITKEQEEVGLRKSTSFSIRWLVEFGHKLAKALVGQVVYREK